MHIYSLGLSASRALLMKPSQELQQLQATLRQYEQSADQRGLGSDRLSLSFGSTIEMKFRRYRAYASRQMQRHALILVFALYGVFLAVDGAIGGSLYQQSWLWLTVVLLCVPPNLFLLFAAHQPDRWVWTHPAALVSALTNGAGLVIVNACSIRAGLDPIYEIQSMQMLFTFFLLGLRWRAAATVAVLLVMGQVLALQIIDLSPREIFVRVFLLASTGVFGAIGCYLQEQTQRLSWLRGEVMRNLSERDGLTGVYNHRAFYERGALLMRQAARESLPLAVIVADVDHFKRFNDTHGHLVGDECLRLVAKAVQQMARRPLDIAARIGGEEFAVMLYGTGIETARMIAEELCDAVRGLSVRDDLRITISAGVASLTAGHDTSIDTLVGCADRALFRSKSAGRDRVTVDDGA